MRELIQRSDGENRAIRAKHYLFWTTVYPFQRTRQVELVVTGKTNLDDALRPRPRASSCMRIWALQMRWEIKLPKYQRPERRNPPLRAPPATSSVTVTI